MEQAIEVNRYGKNTITARQILHNLFLRYPDYTSFHWFNNPNRTIEITSDLQQLFNSYHTYSTIDIIIYDAPYAEITDQFITLITSSSNIDITFDHIIHLNTNPALTCETFYSIYKLLNYTNYNAYYYRQQDIETLDESIFTNLIVVNKQLCKDCGKVVNTTDIIKIDYANQLTILTNIPESGDINHLGQSKSLYNFYLSHFTLLKSRCEPVRMNYSSNNFLDKIIELCEYILTLERSTTEYLIKPNMCIQMIPTDILYQMLVDSNFLGLSETHPKIQRLVQIIQDRFENFYSTKQIRVNLFTKYGLQDFVKSKVISDHLYLFRDFTDYEIKTTLEFIISQLKENPCFKLYLLKDTIHISNMEYVYFENKTLYLFDSCSGYAADYDDGIITAEPFLHVFDDYIKNELIPRYTYTDIETLAFLEELLGSL